MQRRPFGRLSLELKACGSRHVTALELWRVGRANGKSTGSQGTKRVGILIEINRARI
jgi:hypothetical protein